MEIKVEENSGKRLDIYLSDKFLEYTRSYIKTLIDASNILVNGKKVKCGYIVKCGDIIKLDIPEDKLSNITPENIEVEILYEDDDIIIINKPKGMVVHPANGNYSGTLVNSLMYSHKDNLSSINGIIRPGIVHRIDKDTSGILIVAKNDNAHKKLSSQFKIHSIKREYVAIVKGIIKEDKFDINMPIGRNIKDRKKMTVTTKNSKNAITHVEVLKRFYSSNMTYIKATLETGRTHQIRVHLSYKGYPLLGDEVYGRKYSKFKVEGHMLHAMTLGIVHPTSNKYLEFSVEPPKEFKELLDVLEKREK